MDRYVCYLEGQTKLNVTIIKEILDNWDILTYVGSVWVNLFFVGISTLQLLINERQAVTRS